MQRDGRKLYIISHFAGWKRCRSAFTGSKDSWQYDPDDPWAPWSVGQPGIIDDSREDGWRTCSNQLHDLLATREKSELRSQIADWNRAREEVVIIGLWSFVGFMVLFAVTARRLYISLPAVYLSWIFLIVLDRIDYDYTIDILPYLDVSYLIGFAIIVGLIGAFAIRCDASLRSRSDSATGCAKLG